MTMPDALANCLVLNTVSAARTLLRLGDAGFKPFGATVQQFSLMAAIRFHPGESVTGLAQRIHLDRTSLIRNLDLLERKALVRRAEDAGGRARVCELTPEGDGLLDRLLSRWREAQSEIHEGLSTDDIETYLRVSRHLADKSVGAVEK